MLAVPCPSCDRNGKRTCPPVGHAQWRVPGGEKGHIVVGETTAREPLRPQLKGTWLLGKRRVNVYSLCRSGNPPPAPQSGSEIRRSICSANGALRGAIGVFDNRYVKTRPAQMAEAMTNIPLVR